jgi:beta-lactamase regulating signal transducer with metallopeptidase domain
MNETVKLLLSLSLSGSILAVLIFALKPLVKHRFSKAVLYYVWIIVLLRLVVPFSFEESLMNNMFYKQSLETPIASVENVTLHEKSESTAFNLETVSGNLVNNGQAAGEKSIDVELGEGSVRSGESAYFSSVIKHLKNNIFYLWLAGFLVVLGKNIFGYIMFLKHVVKGNKEANPEEKRLLVEFVDGEKQVELKRNSFVNTPMLIGCLKPCILIPDIYFNEKQLRNILLHELTHLRRYDIVIKWLTMITASVHWFNPLLYIVKKEINHACELSCDEAVIKNLTAAERQCYGDTLIAVVSDQSYPVGVLQATMCEEKRTLKERLLAIMQHSRKSRSVKVLSVVLVITIIISGLFLGAGVGKPKVDAPPSIYISSEYEPTKEAVLGSYSWKYKGGAIGDADNPLNFQYHFGNIVSVSKSQQLVITSQKLKKDKKYEFNIDAFSIYKDGKPQQKGLLLENHMQGGSSDGGVYIKAPAEAGEYLYVMNITFKDKGTAEYAFLVRVDMPVYDLAKISKYKTPYIGDNSKVLAIVGNLPVPEKLYFKQQYISMKTDKKPYRLNIYYELREGEQPRSSWPISLSEGTYYDVLQKNALVLFCMIDNLDEVTFQFRNSKSNEKLDETAYDSFYTITRGEIKEKYGDISKISSSLELLEKALASSNEELQLPEKPSNEYTELEKLPVVYNSQLALQNGDVVYTHTKSINSSRLEEFYKAYKLEKVERFFKVRIVLYTVEGDAVIHDLTMNNKEVKLVVDNTRDKFSRTEDRVRTEYEISDITRIENNSSIEYTLKAHDGKAAFSFYVKK